MELMRFLRRNSPLNYEVIEKFYLYEYNPKNGSMKAKTYKVGDIVNEVIKNRLKDSQRYLKECDK